MHVCECNHLLVVFSQKTKNEGTEQDLLEEIYQPTSMASVWNPGQTLENINLFEKYEF